MYVMNLNPQHTTYNRGHTVYSACGGACGVEVQNTRATRAPHTIANNPQRLTRAQLRTATRATRATRD